MDAGVAAVIAASISTLVGGVVGFTSAHLTASQARKAALQQVALPRQMQALDTVALSLFKALSGESLAQGDWDSYISACFWLPTSVRECCLAVLSDRGNTTAVSRAQKKVIAHYASIVEVSDG